MAGMIRFTWWSLVQLYRRGFALFLLAPLIVAIVVVPEFLQHVVEIRLGMFDDIEAQRALANDPQRWAFGYAKLAGLLIAMFAAARFWGTRERDGAWWRLGDVDWLRLAIAFCLFLFAPLIVDLSRPVVPVWVYWTGYTIMSLATLPLIFPIIAALCGDRRSGVFTHYWRDIRWLPLLLVLLVAAYLPAMAAHYGMHYLATDAPVALVWGLMAIDSLIVGLIASLVGAALHLGYAAARPAG